MKTLIVIDGTGREHFVSCTEMTEEGDKWYFKEDERFVAMFDKPKSIIEIEPCECEKHESISGGN